MIHHFSIRSKSYAVGESSWNQESPSKLRIILACCQMWGLLHPKLLSGEGGYYLTMLASAIHGLKSSEEESAAAEDQEVSDCSS